MARAGLDKAEIQLILDRCYALLKTTREPKNFRELLSAGWKELWPERELTGGTLATLYTSLNLDARFTPMGKGNWGLTEWHPRSSRSNVPATSLLGKSYQDEPYRLAGGADEQEVEETTADALTVDEDKGAALEEDDDWLSGDTDE
ncbi:MAG TPA: DNA-directed RNA polymerase subunit delta [Firmicutes bacterium]|nr:DNA-directed RNA polymerase subunit delta [Bacillota bacterium]